MKDQQQQINSARDELSMSSFDEETNLTKIKEDSREYDQGISEEDISSKRERIGPEYNPPSYIESNVNITPIKKQEVFYIGVESGDSDSRRDNNKDMNASFSFRRLILILKKRALQIK